MLKRTVAISILVLANIVLLAVAVVPHHHHGDSICFVSSHCDHRHDCGNEGACSHQDSPQPSDGHEHPYDANCCKVGEWLLPNIEPEHKYQYHCLCTTCDNGHDLFAVLPEFQEPTIQPVYLSFRQTPTDDTILQIFAGRIHGLRAPPFDGTPITRI